MENEEIEILEEITPKKKKSKGNVFLIICFIFLIIVLIATFGSKANEGYILGLKPFIITTGSMEPEYKTNSIVIIKKVDYKDIEVGDVISFRPPSLSNNLAFHRVIEIKDEGFVTKGDNNEFADRDIITEKEFIGIEVFHTNITAWYITHLKAPSGWLFVGLLPIIALIIIFIGFSYIFEGFKKNKKDKKKL
jgi:signal peptidase I, archaeal type